MDHQQRRILIDKVIDKRFDALKTAQELMPVFDDNTEICINDLDKLYYIRASLIDDQIRWQAERAKNSNPPIIPPGPA